MQTKMKKNESNRGLRQQHASGHYANVEYNRMPKDRYKTLSHRSIETLPNIHSRLAESLKIDSPGL